MRIILVLIAVFSVLSGIVLGIMINRCQFKILDATLETSPLQNTTQVETLIDIKENLRQTDKNIKETMTNLKECEKIIKEVEKELKVYENRH